MSAPGNVRRSATTKANWRTPPYIFNYWNNKLRFTLDAAADKENALCANFITEEEDALSGWWDDKQGVKGPGLRKVAWCNPPYGKGMGSWIGAFADEMYQGWTILACVPAATDTEWWHEAYRRATSIWLLDHRISFIDPADGKPASGNTTGTSFMLFTPNPSPYPSVGTLSIPRPPRHRQLKKG